MSTPPNADKKSLDIDSLNPRIRWRIAEGRGFRRVRQAKIRVKEAPVPIGLWHCLQEEKEEEDDDDYDDETFADDHDEDDDENEKDENATAFADNSENAALSLEKDVSCESESCLPLMPYRPKSSCTSSCCQNTHMGIGRVPSSLLMRDGPKPSKEARHKRRLEAWQNNSMKAEVDKIGRTGMEVGKSIDISKFDKEKWTGMQYRIVATEEESRALRAGELKAKQERQSREKASKEASGVTIEEVREGQKRVSERKVEQIQD